METTRHKPTGLDKTKANTRLGSWRFERLEWAAGEKQNPLVKYTIIFKRIKYKFLSATYF